MDFDYVSLLDNDQIYQAIDSLMARADNDESLDLDGQLDRIYCALADPPHGFIFAGEKLERPLNPADLARRIIAPKLQEVGVKWYGWHGFRSGPATNLYALGIEETVIRDILRHADVKVTRAHYIKSTTATSQPVMQKLGKAFQGRREKCEKSCEKALYAKRHDNRINAACGERSSAGRASVCGTEGRGFKSRRSPQIPLASCICIY